MTSDIASLSIYTTRPHIVHLAILPLTIRHPGTQHRYHISSDSVLPIHTACNAPALSARAAKQPFLQLLLIFDPTYPDIWIPRAILWGYTHTPSSTSHIVSVQKASFYSGFDPVERYHIV